MKESYYIGIDLGTTGIKTGMFDRTGTALAFAAREIRLDTPVPGYVEFDGEEYAEAAFDTVREVIEAAGASPDAVKGIGFSSQAQTFVLVDESGACIRPAVSWLDVRAEREAEELSALSREVGGGEITALLSGPKILWLARHEPESIGRTARVLLTPDHLIFRLTGTAVTDPVTAGSTGLYDRARNEWNDSLLKRCGLHRARMPEVLFAGDIAGTLTAHAARALGLPEDVPVAVGTNDQVVGAVGAGNVSPGCASVTLGTALAMIVTTDRTDRVPEGVGVGAHPVRGLHTLLTFAKTSGVVLRWFKDMFMPLSSYEELFDEAAGAPVGAEGVTCLPHFSGTATPDFNASARGGFYGLTLAHERRHMIRALVESLTFTLRHGVELAGRAMPVEELRIVGGGARSDIWLQMIADATGIPVERPKKREAACLGAAELAMAAAGEYDDIAQASQAIYETDRRFEPDAGPMPAYDEAYERYRELYRTLYGC